MLYELRDYEIVPGRMKSVVDRFHNITLALFKKHGVKTLMFWEPVIGTGNRLIYLLEWNSLAEREECWDAFVGDPEWLAAKAETEKEGQIVARVNNSILKEVPSLSAKIRELAG